MIIAYKTIDTPSDNEHLKPMVKEAEENTGIKPSAVDADSGYYSNTSIADLEKEHIDTCIPDSITASSLHKAKVATNNELAVKYTQDDFKYDTQQNSYICPQSKILTFRREYKASRSKNIHKTVKEYWCKELCSSCPDATKCLTHSKVKHRILTVDPNHKTLLLTQEKFKQEEYRQRYRERGSFIERVFGHFKKNLKFTQFHLRSRARVDVETALLCMGFNLLVFKYWL